MPDRYRIQLQVALDTGESWKLTWQDPQELERHYHVDKTLLQNTAKQVREALQGVVDTAKDGQVTLGPSLKKLAHAGADLRKAIFRGKGREIENATYVRDKLLPNLPGPSTLLISLDERIYVPWGLAYDGDPDALPDNPAKIDPDLYAGFWCLKYQVCTLHSIVDASGVKKPRAYEEVQMLTIINQLCWDTAKKNIPEEEKAMFDGALARSKPEIASSKEFFATWGQSHAQIDLLYLYCHAKGDKLALSGEDEISITQFQLQINHDPPQTFPVCLVFLNGCQTAIGAEGGGFMEATGSLGFCGFIGTEAKVPDLFAMRFAADFFSHLLYGEMTVEEIMEKLRRQHWPLSLVYSTCCLPAFKIRRTITSKVEWPKRNLSEQKLIAEKLL
jgi:hypothetical protein